MLDNICLYPSVQTLSLFDWLLLFGVQFNLLTHICFRISFRVSLSLFLYLLFFWIWMKSCVCQLLRQQEGSWWWIWNIYWFTRSLREINTTVEYLAGCLCKHRSSLLSLCWEIGIYWKIETLGGPANSGILWWFPFTHLDLITEHEV